MDNYQSFDETTGKGWDEEELATDIDLDALVEEAIEESGE